MSSALVTNLLTATAEPAGYTETHMWTAEASATLSSNMWDSNYTRAHRCVVGMQTPCQCKPPDAASPRYNCPRNSKGHAV